MPRAALKGFGLVLILIGGCRHGGGQESHQAVRHWDAELSGRLGTAKQADIRALIGEPTAVDLIGDSEVWVYQFGEDNRDIKPEYKAVAPKHDELILHFTPEGTMDHYTAIIEGRSTQRQKSR
jgi:hypothetical protein